jgi:tight adherence protein B
MLILLTVTVFAAAFVISRRGDTATQERLGQFVGGVTEETETKSKSSSSSAAPSALTQSLNQVIEDRGIGKNTATELARADLKITISEYYSMIVISMLGTAVVAWLIYGGFILPLGGLLLGFFLPRFFVKYRQRQRLKKFNDQLGDTITLMANGLRAGYSLLQAIDAVAREMPPPISDEFRRVVREIGLGIDNERAFNNLLRRVPSDDLDLMVTAINVQQEIGGNLAEILEIIGYVIRERVRIKGEIQVLTAQGQMSGYVISALPIVLGLLLYAMNQEYIGRMVFTCEARGVADEICSQPCGWIMIGIGLFGIASGFFAMQKIIDIEV